MNRVSVAECIGYNEDEISRAVGIHFQSLDIKSKLKDNMTIVIKPNLLMRRKPDEFTTTHPAVVAAIIKKLKEFGNFHITIADSPGGLYNKTQLKAIYSASGMESLSESLNVSLNYDTGYQPVSNDDNKIIKTFNIINPLAEADFIINVAKLKTHCMTGLSGGVKNMFGAVPGLMKPELHYRFPDKYNFCNMLVDLSNTIKSDVTFVDAIESMEGNGPSGGNKKITNRIFASYSPFNLDIVLCDFLKLDKNNILTVKAAIDRGFCEDSVDKIEIIGQPDKYFPVNNFKKPDSHSIDFITNIPKPLRPTAKFISEKLLKPKPVIINKKCIGCGKCAESCPANTILIENKKAFISYKDCIKCFCCHEMCPVLAIKVKRTSLFDI